MQLAKIPHIKPHRVPPVHQAQIVRFRDMALLSACSFFDGLWLSLSLLRSVCCSCEDCCFSLDLCLLCCLGISR